MLLTGAVSPLKVLSLSTRSRVLMSLVQGGAAGGGVAAALLAAWQAIHRGGVPVPIYHVPHSINLDEPAAAECPDCVCPQLSCEAVGDTVRLCVELPREVADRLPWQSLSYVGTAVAAFFTGRSVRCRRVSGGRAGDRQPSRVSSGGRPLERGSVSESTGSSGVVIRRGGHAVRRLASELGE